MNRKVYINPKQYSVLKESEWNLHYGGYDNGYGHGGHSMKPHMSDNKHVMVGRDTGHFGSGTYFSTYSFSLILLFSIICNFIPFLNFKNFLIICIC